MERNYDEIIADMLRQIDRHTEMLTRQTEELRSLRLEQAQVNAGIMKQLAEMSIDSKRHREESEQFQREQNIINRQLHDLFLQHATIIDRLIKKNDLKL